GTVPHRLRLAEGARYRAGVEVVAADHDGRLQLAPAHHVVEEQSRPVALAVAEPADARRQPLEREALHALGEPAAQALVLGEELEERPVRPPDVLGVARERDPAERPAALAELVADERRHEARVGEGVLEAALLRE